MDDLELNNPEECPNCAGDSTVPVSCNLLSHILHDHRFNLF
jgi:hypothetical protein